MSDSFYKEFEDRHRGTRDVIKTRLRVYLPFVELLRDHLSDGFTALDLGCGRGEWLELLSENGFCARGVDLDDDMIAECRKRNLDAEREDAVAFLRRLPSETETVVSGFHVAEHLPFFELRALVSEAARVLKPAGLLILETPNPENLVVGANSFYLDPTHERPLPPDLLSFLAEHAGFKRAKVVRLNESRDSRDVVTLATVLMGVSPDYAVIAQKTASRQELKALDDVFNKNYGVTLETAVARYEQSLIHKLDTIIAEQRALREGEEKLQEALAAERETRKKLESELAAERETRSHVEVKLTAEYERLDQILSELAAVYASKSWRITWPLRKLLQVLKWALQMPKRVVRPLLVRIIASVARRLRLTAYVLRLLDHSPGLRTRLNELVVADSSASCGNDMEDPLGDCHADLSETAQRFYRDLNTVSKQETRGKD